MLGAGDVDPAQDVGRHSASKIRPGRERVQRGLIAGPDPAHQLLLLSSEGIRADACDSPPSIEYLIGFAKVKTVTCPGDGGPIVVLKPTRLVGRQLGQRGVHSRA